MGVAEATQAQNVDGTSHVIRKKKKTPTQKNSDKNDMKNGV
jgi:hypothetical protein